MSDLSSSDERNYGIILLAFLAIFADAVLNAVVTPILPVFFNSIGISKTLVNILFASKSVRQIIQRN